MVEFGTSFYFAGLHILWTLHSSNFDRTTSKFLEEYVPHRKGKSSTPKLSPAVSYLSSTCYLQQGHQCLLTPLQITVCRESQTNSGGKGACEVTWSHPCLKQVQEQEALGCTPLSPEYLQRCRPVGQPRSRSFKRNTTRITYRHLPEIPRRSDTLHSAQGDAP